MPPTATFLRCFDRVDAMEDAPRLRREIPLASAYAIVYLGYLWIHPESEAWHWVSLVLVPIGLILALRRSLRQTLASFGLSRERWSNSLLLAIGAGVGLSLLQLAIGSRGQQALEILSTPQGWLMLPVALVFLLLAAGFTEEVFFRGFLQTRLEASFNPWVAIGIVTVAFSVYHIPYAYLNPNWPSAGNIPAAISAAFTQGIPGGLILGWLYLRSDHNLVACIALHSLINWLPALTMIKFNGG